MSIYLPMPAGRSLLFWYLHVPSIEKSLTDQLPVQKVLIVQQQDFIPLDQGNPTGFMKNFDPWSLS